ncbi:MAG: carboxypeptidase regulatory-like domain-containing protein, partial [Candidatus Coatesbacteria bacterium]
IALTLSPAEEAMLAAVPEAQLRAIVASTKVSPSLRPAFLGYAAAAMLAALGASAAYGCDDIEYKTYGIASEIPPETAATADVPDSPGKAAREDKSGDGKVSGTVTDNKGNPLSDVMVSVVGTNRFAVTNAEGSYLITPVPAGIITVEAFSTEYGSIERTDVKILPDFTTSLTFQYTNPPLETPAEPRIKYNKAYQGIRPDVPAEKGE